PRPRSPRRERLDVPPEAPRARRPAPGARPDRARRGRRSRRRAGCRRRRLRPETVRLSRARGAHPRAPPPRRAGRADGAPRRRPGARSRTLRGPTRRNADRADREGVRDPRVLHAERGRARHADDAPRTLLGRDLRRPLEPRRRPRRPGPPEDRPRRVPGAPAHDPRRRVRSGRARAVRLAKSLRWQLTLAFTGVAAAVVVAIAGGMAVVLEHAVWAHLDAALEEEAETLVGLRGLGQLRDFTEAVARIGSERDLGTGKFIRMIESDGTEVVRFGAIPHAIAAAGPPGARGRRHLTVGQRRDARRVFWYATPDGGWMEIGVAVGDHLATIRSARMAIAGAAAFLLTALALLALTITTRATAELARLSAELETVEAGSLGRRLAPRSTTEVDRLAGVLNRLL